MNSSHNASHVTHGRIIECIFTAVCISSIHPSIRSFVHSFGLLVGLSVSQSPVRKSVSRSVGQSISPPPLPPPLHHYFLAFIKKLPVKTISKPNPQIVSTACRE